MANGANLTRGARCLRRPSRATLSARAGTACGGRARSTRRCRRAAVTRMTGRARSTSTIRRLARRLRLVFRRRIALEHVVAHTIARSRRRGVRVLPLRARCQVCGAATVRRHRRLRRLPLALLTHRYGRARSAIVCTRPACARHACLTDAVGNGATGGFLTLACWARAPHDAVLLGAGAGGRERAAGTCRTRSALCCGPEARRALRARSCALLRSQTSGTWCNS